MSKRALLLLALTSSLALAAPVVYLTGMRIQSGMASSRFTFILTQKTFGRVNYLPAQDKLIVELANTRAQFNIQNVNLLNANVASIQVKTGESLQFIFALKRKIKWNIKFLPSKDQSKGAQLQLDILSVKPDKQQELQKQFQKDALQTFSQLQNESKNKIKKPPVSFITFDTPSLMESSDENTISNILPPKKPHIFTIVIDAGHGGKDPGARGQGGNEEKHIVLAIARNLANQINRTKNMRALLTRDGDYYVPLRQRMELARKANADLFIAIHADAYFNNTSTGASVYALSKHGATTEAARWLAKQDNYSELDNVELNALKDRSPVLRSMLIDLSQTTTIRDSLYLGTKILDALDRVSSLHFTNVQQAPFMVLKSPDTPSILVETGFISNSREEQRLSTQYYQKKISLALFQGIRNYVSQLSSDS